VPVILRLATGEGEPLLRSVRKNAHRGSVTSDSARLTGVSTERICGRKVTVNSLHQGSKYATKFRSASGLREVPPESLASEHLIEIKNRDRAKQSRLDSVRLAQNATNRSRESRPHSHPRGAAGRRKLSRLPLELGGTRHRDTARPQSDRRADGSVRPRSFPPIHSVPRISISRAAEKCEGGYTPPSAGCALICAGPQRALAREPIGTCRR